MSEAPEEKADLSAKIPVDLADWLEEQAKAQLTSKSSIVRQILDRARRESLVLKEQPQEIAP
jgi:hypothetical protein